MPSCSNLKCFFQIYSQFFLASIYRLALKLINVISAEPNPLSNLGNITLGQDPATKSDEFLGKFQTAFAPPPPPHFMLQFFVMDMVAFMQGGIGQIVSVNINTIGEKTYLEP